MGILQISVVIGHEVSYISCFWSMMYLMLVLSVKLVKLSILVQARSVAFSQWCGKAVPDCFIECKIGSSEATWMRHMPLKIMFTTTKAAQEHLFFGKSSWG